MSPAPNSDSGSGPDTIVETAHYPTADGLPDPPQDDVIDPIETPCPTDSGVHDPVVTTVISDGKYGNVPVVKCRQCGALCDPAVPWSEYKHAGEGR